MSKVVLLAKNENNENLLIDIMDILVSRSLGGGKFALKLCNGEVVEVKLNKVTNKPEEFFINEAEKLKLESTAVATMPKNKKESPDLSDKFKKWLPVDSSNLHMVKYNKDTMELGVIFNNGMEYVYSDVPIQDYVKLVSSESKGKTFNNLIKDKYEFDKVD